MKEAITKFHNSWNIQIDMQIYSHEDLEIWRDEDAVGWIDFKIQFQ